MAIIGFDLDSTLVDLEMPIKQIFKKRGLTYKLAVDWNFSNYPKKLKDEIFEMFKDANQMCTLKPFKYAKKVIKYLQKKGHTVYIITARHTCIVEATKKFVYKLFKIDPIVVNFGENKLHILRKNNISIYIDDCPHQVLDLKKEGIDCVLISNKDTLYNHYARKDCFYLMNMKHLYKLLKVLHKVE